MAADSFTVTESRGWGSRLGSSFKGLVVGLILFGISFPLLWWNEGRAVARYKTLKEGQGAVVATTADSVDPELEDRLVHISGQAGTDEILADPVFAVSENAIHLERSVEMYQWDEHSSTETKKKLGGGEKRVTTYRYEEAWSADLVDSGKFEEPAGHQNPGVMPYRSRTESATDVRVGAYRLSPRLIDAISASEEIPLPDDILGKLPQDLGGKAQRQGRILYIGANPNAPAVGDLRVSFSRVPATVVSILARQQGDQLNTFTTKHGAIEELHLGEHTADAMFQREKTENKMFTWILRGVGFLLMAIGMKLLTEPLGVLGDVVPFIGSIIRGASGLIVALLAFALSAITIGIAWLVYRPLLGGGLLAIAVGAIFWGRSMAKKRVVPAAPATAPPSAPPPPPPPPPA